MLTKRQKQVLAFIMTSTKRNDMAPSLKEIATHLKLSSVSTAYHHVQALALMGYINKEENHPRTITVADRDRLVRIPLSGRIAAGEPIEPIPERAMLALPRYRLPKAGEFFALQVVGDSMIDENINNGDIVVVKRQTTARNGQTAVVLLDGDKATLKKLYKERTLIRLQPSNKKMNPILVRRERDIAIQGIVVDILKDEAPDLATGAPHLPTGTPGTGSSQTPGHIEQFVDRVFQADCLEFMKELPPRSVDMILCDLPYGHTQNNWDSLIPLDKLWRQYERIMKDDAVIVLTSQGLFTAQLILSNPRLFKYKIIWVKSKPTNFLNAKKQPLRRHEDICVFYRRQPHYQPQMTAGLPYNKGFRKEQLSGCYGDFKTVEVKSNGERYPTDVVYFKTAESEGSVYHPTQKPVELGRYLIRTFAGPNAIVLDNACGSGSFLVAAILEGRRFIGIEKNEEVYLFKKERIDYIRVCKNRIEDAQRKVKDRGQDLFRTS